MVHHMSLIYGPNVACVNSSILHCALLVRHHSMLPSSNSTSNFIAAWYENPNGTFLHVIVKTQNCVFYMKTIREYCILQNRCDDMCQ